ncbi:YcaO-like family protein [Roseibium sp.]|uniref:YcaO-like family protein n=1 Tax=Roseibium sp. TaxID=1936156 RepID=UPI002629B5A2|nr:YcaO-like family protein [Roseibium sp.]
MRVGLLVPGADETAHWPEMADGDLSLFLPLLTSFDIRLVPMTRADCPLFFCTGLLKPIRPQDEAGGAEVGPIPAGGQAGTARNAALGCLGELAERISLWTMGRYDTRIVARQQTQSQVELGEVLGLSDLQALNVARHLQFNGSTDNDGVPEWGSLSNSRINVRSLADGRLAQLPSVGVLFREMELETGSEISFASSVGCAVWRDLKGARERAFLELVERDAVAQSWYNRLGITRLSGGLLSEILPGQLMDFLIALDRHWEVFAVQTDLDVHVVMAMSWTAGGRRTAFGSSAGWDIASACHGAIEEMLQSENALHLMDKAYPVTGQASIDGVGLPRHLAYARNKSILEDLPIEAALPADETLCQRDFSYDGLLQSCLDRKFEIWEFDATRPDLKIPCVKLLSPDLCSWEPRFGKQRLYTGVVERGLRPEPAREEEFSSRPFPF